MKATFDSKRAYFEKTRSDLDDNINLDQAKSVVKTYEGITWKELIKNYINLFGAVNYEQLKNFVILNTPEHFVESQDRVSQSVKKNFLTRFFPKISC